MRQRKQRGLHFLSSTAKVLVHNGEAPTLAGPEDQAPELSVN